MPKLVNSAAYQVFALEQQTAKLQRQLAAVTAERNRLGRRCAPCPPSAGSSCPPPACVPRRPSPHHRSPHFDSSVCAAGRDNMNVSPLITVNGVTCRYHDGRLINPRGYSMDGWGEPLFAQSTISQRKRSSWVRTEAQQKIWEAECRRRARRRKRTVCSARNGPDSDGAESQPASETNSDGEVSGPDTTATPDTSTAALSTSPDAPSPPPPGPSPSHQNWITQDAALANCFRDHPAGLEYARVALELTRESLWDRTRERHPDLFARFHPYGPTFIGATRNELCGTTLNWRLAPEISDELYAFADLRNFVCHPNPADNLAAYDEPVAKGEAVMAKLGDRDRLRRLWAARDAMRGHAERTLAEVREHAVWAEIQGSYADKDGTWEPDHVDLFKRVLRLPKFKRDDSKVVHPVVGRVAARWGEVNAFGKSDRQGEVVW